MRKSFGFFATSTDIKNALVTLEKIEPVKYISMELYKSKEIKEYMSCYEIDNLGYSSGESQGSDNFLVMFKDNKCNVDAVLQKKDGTYNYFVKQLYNQESVVLRPGGSYQNKYHIVGEVATMCYENEKSAKIFKAIKKAFTKILKNKVPGYLVGDGIYEIKNQVRLVTIGIGEPVEYDLKLPDKK